MYFIMTVIIIISGPQVSSASAAADSVSCIRHVVHTDRQAVWGVLKWHNRHMDFHDNL
jgi:hypothetical protein